jgi:hypothetical protein
MLGEKKGANHDEKHIFYTYTFRSNIYFIDLA